MSIKNATFVKAGVLAVVVCIFLALILLGILNFNNKQDDTKEENNGTITDYSDASADEYYLPNGQPIIRLPKYGQLQGSLGFTAWTNQTIFQFRNVPFAESPSGSRRFKAPVPIKPWNGIRNAGKYGRKCPTVYELKGLRRNEASDEDLEDCLNMAIFSAKLNASYAVMVYIHGGGFYNNNADHYPPQYLMERDIILVVVQYRLDALGFLSTNSDEIPGNAGLMDAVLALKFVKENIRFFGGDPNKITIFGQSSGGAMVSALVISPNVPRNLFQQAIVQSGTVFSSWAYITDPIADARTLAEAAGLNPNQTIDALNRGFIEMNIFDLFKAIEKVTQMTVGRTLTVGGPDKLLPDTPRNIVTSKYYNQSLPLIIGAVKHDGTYYAGEIYNFLEATNKLNDKNFMVNELVNCLSENFGLHDDADLFAAVASLTFWPAKQLDSGNFTVCVPGIIDMMGTGLFKAPALKFAKVNARNNQHKTYLYTFDYKGQHSRFGYGGDVSRYPFVGGVHHSDDLIYLFPDPPDVAKLNAADTKIAQSMVDLWTSFAIEGVPKLPQMQSKSIETNETVSFDWKPFEGLNGPYLHIDQHLSFGDDFRVEFTAALRNASEIEKIS